MKPSSKNFCGGAFPDWLEVNLTSKCNAKCSWCVERDGFHPTKIAPWDILVKKIETHGAENVILLGGEPTLYKDIAKIINVLKYSYHRVYITTNGSKLNKNFIRNNLKHLYGINISLHHYDMIKNEGVQKFQQSIF